MPAIPLPAESGPVSIDPAPLPAGADATPSHDNSPAAEPPTMVLGHETAGRFDHATL